MVAINGANGFDASTVDPDAGFEPIPDGEYVAIITESEMKPTSKGTGQYLQVKMEIVDGQHKGRTLFDRFNLQNPSEQAVNIAMRQFSALCHAVNVLRVQDSCQLHNIPFIAKVKCKKRTDNGEWTNEIGGYKAKSATSSAPQQQATGAAPWARQ